VNPAFVIGAIGVIAAATVVALVLYISKAHRQRRATTQLSVALVIAFYIASVIQSYTSVYYRAPAWLVALTVVFWGAVAALFVLIGRDVHWRPTAVAALVGLMFATGAVFFAFGMATDLGGEAFFPYTMRARQIAEAKGFQALLPSGQQLQLDSLPIDALPSPENGFYAVYKGFTLEERKATGPMTTGDLNTLAARGPSGMMGVVVQQGAQVTTATVGGFPAAAISYEFVSSVNVPGAPPRETGAIVKVRIGDVEALLFSTSGMKEKLNGGWTPYKGLSVEELMKIAETLKPAK
jgi:hypothetical protein